MGERGPVPIPYARRRNRRPAVGKAVTVARPPTPRKLRDEARKEWHRIVPELEAMGLLALVDRSVLIRYCTAWAEWCELDDGLQKTGPLIKGRRDGLVRNPLWMLRNAAEQTLSDLGRQLGLTPAARLRAGVKHEQPKPDEGQTQVTAINEYRKRLAK